ncbi:MAG: flippase-like domain-containing protein [Candidatus Bathyarchaeota archaeon]|nr:flippase-like domain-containing protein [Candidatus Bathyarchaeota archaeon]
MKPRTKKIGRLLLQTVFTVAIFAALLWYIGFGSFWDVLSNIKMEYLVLVFAAYFGINLLFTVRLRIVLAKEGLKTSFIKTLFAQYAGMLTSDVTPGRSGYVLTPIYLRDQNIPLSVSLSAILGIQSVEFLAKVVGGVGALVFLTKVSTVSLQTADFLIIGLGIGLMLTGAVLLAAMSWSQRVIVAVKRVTTHRLIARFTRGLMGKLEEYAQNAKKTRKALPAITILTFMCWILKGFEWYFLGLALGITQIPWVGYFLIHPLVTALAFVPITPAGAGIQEFGIVGVFSLIGVSATTAGAFAIVARAILVIQDLVGVPQIVRTSSTLLTKKPEVDITS